MRSMKNIKIAGNRLLSLFLTGVLCVSLAFPSALVNAAAAESDSGAQAPALSGSGTVQDPYLIGSASDLVTFEHYVNSSEGSGTEAYYRQTADIDLSGIPDWTPIGETYDESYTPYYFSGVYDGNGKSIKNMTVSGTTYLGLFGNLNGATVMDLTVGGTVKSTSTRGYSYIGGLAACVTKNETVISGCTSNVTIQATGTGVGGILGQSEADTTIKNCLNIGSINVSLKLNQYYYGAGGIIGHSSGDDTFTGCVNTGKITSTNPAGSTNLGGIAGGVYPEANTVLNNCYNTGKIYSADATASSCGIGGIVGKRTTWYDSQNSSGDAYNFVMSDCYNTGMVSNEHSGGTCSGGIIGFALAQDSYETNILTDTNTNHVYSLEGAAPFVICSDSGTELSGSLSTAKTFASSGVSGLVSDLGSGFCADLSPAINKGYPVLVWQNPATKHSVTFHMTDSYSGNDIQTASIDIQKNGQSVDYDKGLVSGTYSYTVAKSNFQTASGTLYIGRDSKDVYIKMAPSMYRYQLHVSPATAKVKLTCANASVKVPDPEINGDVADYSISLPTSKAYGDYAYEISAHNYVTGQESFSLTQNTEKTVSLEAAKRYNIQLRPTDQDGNPVTIREASVTNTDYNAAEEANADGSYSLMAGNYSVLLKAKGYSNVKESFTVSADDTLTVKMPTAVWDGISSDTSWYSSGKDSYYIYNAAELAGLAELVNAGNYFSGKTVYLSDDIDLGGKTWDPIADAGIAKGFAGTLDGQNHEIKNLLLGEGNYQGLFGNVKGGTIKNLSVRALDNRDTKTSESDTSVHAAGGYSAIIAASAQSASFSKITTAGTLYSVSNNIGAISGYMNSSVVDSCVNKADIYGSYSVGGLVGNLYTFKSTIRCSANYGSVTAGCSYSGTSMGGGGIAGFSSVSGGTVFDRCVNNGSVGGSCNLGGILGSSASNPVTVTNCYNSAGISISDTTYTGWFSGGILGFSGGASILKNNYNRGSVSVVSGDYCGSVIGSLEKLTNVADNYYLEGTAAVGNSVSADQDAVISVFSESQDNTYTELISNLGAAYISDSETINAGFPVLKWQNAASEYMVSFDVSYDTESNAGKERTITVNGKTVGQYAELTSGTYIYTVKQEGYKTVSATVTVNGEDVTVPVRMAGEQYKWQVTADPATADVTLYDSDGDKVAADSNTDGVITYMLYNGDYQYTMKAFGYEESVSAQALSGVIHVSYADGSKTLRLKQLPMTDVTFDVALPAGMEDTAYTVSIYSADDDFDGVMVAQYDSVKNEKLPTGNYTYEIKALGCVTAKGSFTVASDPVTVPVDLEQKVSTGWDGSSIDTDWYYGNEDAASYYLYNEAELAGFAYLVNEKAVTFSEKTVNVMSDMDMGKCTWTSVGAYSGSSKNYFAGTFNGNFYKIKFTDAVFAANGSSMGFFGYIKNAAVKNLILTGSASGSYQNSGSDFNASAAGLAGYAESSTVSSCSNRMSLNFNASISTMGIFCVGGIIGYDYASGVSASNNISPVIAELSGCTSIGNMNAGGVVGYLNCSSGHPSPVTGCYNTGSISSEGVTSSVAGGIIGMLSDYSNFTLGNCYAAGPVKSTIGKAVTESCKTGALVGACYTNYGQKTNCYYLDSLSSAYGTANTEQELKNVDFIKTLGTDFQANNNGYPLNSWEAGVYSISIESMPEKTTYNDLEQFDATGMQIRLHYAEGDAGTVVSSGWTVQDGDSLKASQTAVTIDYQGAKLSIPVTVNQIVHEVSSANLGFLMQAPMAGQTPVSSLALTDAQKKQISDAKVVWSSGGTTVNGVFEAGKYYRAQVTLDAVYETGNVYYNFADLAIPSVTNAYEILHTERSADGKSLTFTVTFKAGDSLTAKASHLYYEGDGSSYADCLNNQLTVSIDGTASDISVKEIESAALKGLGKEDIYTQKDSNTAVSHKMTGVSLYQFLKYAKLPADASDESTVSINGKEFKLGQIRAMGKSYDGNGEALAKNIPFLLAYGQDGVPLTDAGPLELAAPMTGSSIQNSTNWISNVRTINVSVVKSQTFVATFQSENTKADGSVLSIVDSYGNSVYQGAVGAVTLNSGEMYHYEVATPGFVTEKGYVNKESTIKVRMIAAWDGTYQEPEKDADGYYLIQTPEEMAWFNYHATRVNTTEAVSMSSANIRLAADISMAGFDWYPISGTELSQSVTVGKYYSGGAYTGKFEGQGHTIYGLTINRENLYGQSSLGGSVLPYSERVEAVGGLFGYTKGATISKVGVEGSIHVVDRPEGTSSNFLQVGGIAGFAESGTVISGCYADMDIKMNIDVYTSSDGVKSVRGNPEYSDTYIGGIAGSLSLQSKIESCYSSGTYYGEGTRTVNVGGIAGGTRSNENTVTMCYSKADLYANPDLVEASGWNSYIGGIVGKVNAVTSGAIPEISYCFALNGILDGGNGANTEAGRVVGNGSAFDLGGKYNYALDSMNIQHSGSTYYDPDDSGYRSSWGRDVSSARAQSATAYTNVYWTSDLWNFGALNSYPIFVWQSAPQTEPAHQHSYHAVVTDPTCTERGYTTYTCDCGDSYVSDYTNALGHDYKVVEKKDAKVGEEGYILYQCTRCGDTYKEIIPALDKPIVNPLKAPAVTVSNDTATGTVKLSWKAVGKAKGYEIYRSSSKSGTYTKVAKVMVASWMDTSNKTVGKSFYYKVLALGTTADENSPKSAAVSACCKLNKVTVKISKASAGLRLSWTKSANASGYIVYRSASKAGSYKQIVSIKGKAYTDKSTKKGKTYYYRVKAVYTKNRSADSAYSNVASKKS